MILLLVSASNLNGYRHIVIGMRILDGDLCIVGGYFNV